MREKNVDVDVSARWPANSRCPCMHVIAIVGRRAIVLTRAVFYAILGSEQRTARGRDSGARVPSGQRNGSVKRMID